MLQSLLIYDRGLLREGEATQCGYILHFVAFHRPYPIIAQGGLKDKVHRDV
jgi:hypothetical protein